MPFLYECIRVYLTTNFGQLTVLAHDRPDLPRVPGVQEIFVFFITIYVGAGLIANDRRANALQIYLSKPLTRFEYVAGKAATLLSFLLRRDLGAGDAAAGRQACLPAASPSSASNLFLLPAITVYAFLQVMLATFAMLALSSLSKSARFVGMMYAGLIFFTDAIFAMLKFLVKASGASLVSPTQSLAQLGDAIFRVPPRHETPVVLSPAVIVLLLVGSGRDARAEGARRGGGGVSFAQPHRPLVEADHLSKWYGQVIGLNDVSVTVPPGITGLLGPNGAGKSTFMKLITGQLKPSKGSIRVLGEPIWGNPKLFFRIGFCPEQDAFYERMTGLEWVTALVRLNGYPEAEAAAAAKDALEKVELLDAADKKIGAYSKGMRQRVKLAQALVHDPELLILDEPLTGMDPMMRRRTIRLIKDWARAGKSILVSSHILHEIEAMTSNILLINNGRILAEGNVHQIRDLIDEHPHTVYIRAADPRALARRFLADDDVLSLKFEEGAIVVQTAKPDVFYTRLTELAASGEAGAVDEVASPDDNLAAVFQYLVK